MTSSSQRHRDEPELANRLRLAVMRLSRRLRQESADQLTLTQLATLSTIEREGPLTLGELAAQERVAPPTVTRVVGALESHGFVTKVADPADRRVCRVGVSADGARYLDKIRRRRTAWLSQRLGDLEADERARLAAAVAALEHLTDEGDRA